MYDTTAIYKATDSKFIFRTMLDYPWPLGDRELVMHLTGIMDYTNKAMITLSKQIETGETFFDYVSPKENPKYPRERADSLNLFFQYISPT